MVPNYFRRIVAPTEFYGGRAAIEQGSSRFKPEKQGHIVVANSFKRRAKALSLLILGAFSMAAYPAMAKTSATSADLPSAAFAIQGVTGNGDADGAAATGDAQFAQLFTDWQAMDNSRTGAAATVSIPSRMPLDNAALTSDYGMRTHPVLGGRRAHSGVDLAATTGTPIYATADGIVSKAGRFSSYGLYVSIEHGAQLQTRFAHMSRVAVANGARVKKGDIIGYVGSTGRSTGPHLHYEVRIAGKAVNPIPYMVDSEAQQAYRVATGDKNAARGGD